MKRATHLRRLSRLVVLVMLISAILPLVHYSAKAESAGTAETEQDKTGLLVYLTRDTQVPDVRPTPTANLLGKVTAGKISIGDKVIHAGRDSNGDPKNVVHTVTNLIKGRDSVDSAEKGETVRIVLSASASDRDYYVGDALIAAEGSKYVNARNQFIHFKVDSLEPGAAAFVNAKKYYFYGQISDFNIEADMYYPTFDKNTGKNTGFWALNSVESHVFHVGEQFSLLSGIGDFAATVTVDNIPANPIPAIGKRGGNSISYDDMEIVSLENDARYPWTLGKDKNGFFVRSGNDGKANSSSQISITFRCKEPVAVQYRVNSRNGQVYTGDYSRIVIDNNERYRFTTQPEAEWSAFEYTLDAGTHTLTWIYTKDGETDPKDDCFILRDLAFLPSACWIYDANGGKYADREKNGRFLLYPDSSQSYQSLMNYMTLRPFRPGYEFVGYTFDKRTGLNAPLDIVRMVDWEDSATGGSLYAYWQKLDYNAIKQYSYENELSEGAWTFIDASNSGDLYSVWHHENGGTYRNPVSSSSNKCIRSCSEVDGTQVNPDTWAISPKISIGKLKYAVKFDAAITQGDHLAVYVGTSSDRTKMKKLAEYTCPGDSNFHEYSIPLEGYNGKNIYLGFRHYNSKNGSLVSLDNVRVISEFADVQAGSDKGKDPYYYDAVYWASSKGITGGVKGKDGVARNFDPQGICTRAQMVAFLWRMVGCPEADTYYGSGELTEFKDVSKDAYYYKAVRWAQARGITGGYPDGTFKPDKPCTRAQAVSFLDRLGYLPAPEETTNFVDVEIGSYYCKSVSWAQAWGITGGYSDGTFRPDGTCTRAQM